MKSIMKIITAAAVGVLLAVGSVSGANAARPPQDTTPPVADIDYIVGDWQDPTNTYRITNTSGSLEEFLVKIEDQVDGSVTFQTYLLAAGQSVILETPRYTGETVYIYRAGDYRWTSLDVAHASDYDRYGKWYIHVDSDDPVNNPVTIKRLPITW